MSSRRLVRLGFTAASLVVMSCPSGITASADTPPVVHILAGGELGDGGSALQAKVDPAQVAMGSNGDIYELGLSRVRKIDHATGVISTVLGSSNPGHLHDGEQATAAGMSAPYVYRLVGVGADGTVYVTQTYPGSLTEIYHVGADGIVHHLFDDFPKPVAVATDGTVYTTGTNQVFRHAPGTTAAEAFAGTGTSGHTGEGGPATAAEIGSVTAMTVAPDGTVYFVAGTYVQHVAADGTIHTVGGTGTFANSQAPDGAVATSVALTVNTLTVDPAGRVYLLNYVSTDPAVRVINLDGTLGTVIASTPTSYFPVLAADSTGVLYPGSVQLFHYAGDGSQKAGPGTVVAGSTAPQSPDGAIATDAYLASLGNAVYDRSGRLLFTSLGLIRTVTDGRLTTVAGGGTPADGYGDGLPGPQAATHAWSMTTAPDGNIYFVDIRPLGFGDVENRIRVLHPDGTVATIAGGGADAPPDSGTLPATSVALPGQTGHALAATNDHVYYATEDNVVYDISGGTISRYAGGGNTPIDGNTPATPAQDAYFDGLGAIAIDPTSGDLYATERHNVVRLGTDDKVRQAFATSVQLLQLAFGPDGSLYYSDGAIQRRWPDGGTAQVAGNGKDNTDGAPILSAHIGGLTGLDIGPDGSLALPGSRDDGTWEVRVADAYTPAPAPTTLTTTASASQVATGAPGTITATLHRGTSKPPDRTLMLQQRPSGAAEWTTVASEPTDSSGASSFLVSPRVNTAFRVTYAGISTEQPAKSSVFTISVVPHVTAHLASAKIHKGGRTTLRATVAPNEHNHSVNLQIHRRTGWHTVATHTLSSSSTVRFRIAAAQVGTFAYRVNDPATSTAVAGTSKPVKLKVVD